MCNCHLLVDQQLEEKGSNTRLDIPLVFHQGQVSTHIVSITTCKRDIKKREKPIKVFATYCPFCGEKYPKNKEEG